MNIDDFVNFMYIYTECKLTLFKYFIFLSIQIIQNLPRKFAYVVTKKFAMKILLFAAAKELPEVLLMSKMQRYTQKEKFCHENLSQVKFEHDRFQAS